MIKLPNTNFMSDFAGIAANEPQTFFVDIPPQNIPAAGVITYIASTTMPNARQLPDVQVQYAGISSNYWWIEGPTIYQDPGFLYTITTNMYFQGSTLFVRTDISNLDFSPLPTPVSRVTCRGFLYDVPYW